MTMCSPVRLLTMDTELKDPTSEKPIKEDAEPTHRCIVGTVRRFECHFSGCHLKFYHATKLLTHHRDKHNNRIGI